MSGSAGDSPGLGSSTKHPRTTYANHDRKSSISEKARAQEGHEVYNMEDDFATIGVGELLECDPRPTLVFDLEVDSKYRFEPVFSNQAFRSNNLLASGLSTPIHNLSQLRQTPLTDFRLMIQTMIQDDNLHGPSCLYAGVSWSAFTLHNRWKLICGSYVDNGTKSHSKSGSLSSENPLGNVLDNGNARSSKDTQVITEVPKQDKKEAGTHTMTLSTDWT